MFDDALERSNLCLALFLMVGLFGLVLLLFALELLPALFLAASPLFFCGRRRSCRMRSRRGCFPYSQALETFAWTATMRKLISIAAASESSTMRTGSENGSADCAARKRLAPATISKPSDCGRTVMGCIRPLKRMLSASSPACTHRRCGGV